MTQREIFVLVLQEQQQGRERPFGLWDRTMFSQGQQITGGCHPAGPEGWTGWGGDLCSTLITPRGKQGAHDLGLGEQGVLQITSGKHCRAMGRGGRELSEQHPASCKCS